jgi:PAS domain S-box-containing protein
MSDAYRVLLVEDCNADAFFTLRALSQGGMQVHFDRVETAAQLEGALAAESWDFILSDYRLPGFDGFAALEVYKKAGLDIPFIVVSGLIGEEQAVKLIKAGAHDYVMKDNLARLVPTVKRELHAAGERRARRCSHDTEVFLASIVRDCNDAIFGTTLAGSLITWNKGAEKLYGYNASEIVGGPVTLLESSHFHRQTEMLKKLRISEEVPHFETVHMRKNGTPVEVSLTISPIKEPKGRVIAASTLVQEISGRKQQESERIGLIKELSDALARERQSHNSTTSTVGVAHA